jgi:ParB family chromosome partitioning protein
VRQVEELARRDGKAVKKARKPRVAKDPDTLAMEKRLSDALGLRVAIDHRGDGGILHIHYGSLDQLDDVARRLSG